MTPVRGDVWLFDLGMRRKFVLSWRQCSFRRCGQGIVIVVPHTTELRRSEYEVSVKAHFLKPGAFLVQGVSTYPTAWAIRKLGTPKEDQFDSVFAKLLDWLGHS